MNDVGTGTPSAAGIVAWLRSPEGVRRQRIAFVSAAVVAILALGYHLADVLNPFLIALLIAYILDPLVEWLERRRVRRIFAVSVLFGVVLVSLGSLLVFGVFSAADHLRDIRLELAGERVLDEKVPSEKEQLERLRKDEGPYVRGLQDGRFFHDEDMDGERKVGLIERITANLAPRLRRLPSGWLERVTKALEAQAGQSFGVAVDASKGLQVFLSQLWNFFGYVFLVPLYTFFLLLSLSDMKKQVAENLPGRSRERILDVGRRLDRALAAFFRGRLLIGLGKGLLTGLGLYLVGVRFAFFIGAVSGILSIIPLVGPLVGGGLAVAFAYDPGVWGARCFGVLVVLLAVELVENLVYPWLMGRNVGLHPLALILSVFCFGRLFGLFGVLLAVPIACVVKIALQELVLPQVKALAAEAPDG